ncbi:hypothetical protein NDU88_007240 [Pleurodeles waltl]|uniref:Uncharacterized protein n=1 Tax=Pleurodeles waltl TaxID=8319 RepID=A0AAV7WH30_PLEWA|nr:hypothetical protein NDU88_007240 [Pleurodeles waltl]
MFRFSHPPLSSAPSGRCFALSQVGPGAWEPRSREPGGDPLAESEECWVILDSRACRGDSWKPPRGCFLGNPHPLRLEAG